MHKGGDHCARQEITAHVRTLGCECQAFDVRNPRDKHQLTAVPSRSFSRRMGTPQGDKRSLLETTET